jgi:hypothetical protein
MLTLAVVVALVCIVPAGSIRHRGDIPPLKADA